MTNPSSERDQQVAQAFALLDNLRLRQEASQQQIDNLRLWQEASQQQIDNLRLRQEASQQQIDNLRLRQEASQQQIDDLRSSFVELREGQALVAQFFVEQREVLNEFRTATNAALSRIDRTLDYLTRRENET